MDKNFSVLPKVYKQGIEVSSSLSLSRLHDDDVTKMPNIRRSQAVTSLARLKISEEHPMKCLSHSPELAGHEKELPKLNKSSTKDLMVPELRLNLKNLSHNEAIALIDSK